MKILQVHNHYRFAGGEDIVVEAEKDLLTDYGHEVHSFCVSNDDITGTWQAIRVALQTHYSSASRLHLAKEIAKCRPDIVHVHNFFPLLTPSIYDACRDAGVPVIQTLHNYRCICPNALLLRNGRVCEKCIITSPYLAVLRSCYRNSILGTLAIAHMVEYHRRRNTWQKKVDQFIALSQFAKSRFVMAGFPEGKINVKPNFVKNQLYASSLERKGALFVGRLSPEKGIHVLLDAWSNLNYPIRIVGDGPFRKLIELNNLTNITLLGHLDTQTVEAEMNAAEFLVMPSVWNETFGLVIIEAFAHGLPVIASRLGSMVDLIDDGVTGLHFESGNAIDLTKKVSWAIENPDKMRRMGDRARRLFEEKFTPESNYKILIDIYNKMLNTT